MAWTADQLPDLSKRVAVVTGANSGIGLHAARGLAAHGARVVLACRRPEAGAAAADQLRATTGADVEAVQVDLSSMESVRTFAASWDGPLDLLVNNAGVMAPPKRVATADGFELQFGTNHLAHYVLTGLLMPALLASEFGARVVTVSSIAHHGGDESVLEGNAGAGYEPQHAYANSKLANLLFARHLHRELTARGLPVVSTAAHPGVSATGLFVDREGMGSNPLLRTFGPLFLRLFTQSSRAGARAPLFASASGEPGSYTGPQRWKETRGPIGPARLSRHAADDALARRLWRVSEELTGFHYRWSVDS